MTGLEQEINKVVEVLGNTIPRNIDELFIRSTGISERNFFAVIPEEMGTVAGVDGSNAMLLDAGFFALAGFRATVSLYNNNENPRRGVTPIRFNFIGPGENNDDFNQLYLECFGKKTGYKLSNADPYKVSSVIRETLEYFVSLETIKSLKKDSLLLIDGAFRIGHISQSTLIEELFSCADEAGVHICAVTKQCEVTWGSGYPLIPAVMRAAERFALSAPWWIKIDDNWINGKRTPEWNKGSIFVTLLHSCARSALKVEIPKSYSDERVSGIMKKLAAVSCDGRIPGYPFPLFDAHRTCIINREVAFQLRTRIIEGMARSGIQHREFKTVWEDIHAEFNHY